MTFHDLSRKVNDHPFKPFRIKLVNNASIDLWEPGMLVIGDSSAVIATKTEKDDRGVRFATDWKTVSIAHMLEFSDLNAKGNGSRRKH